MSWSVNANGKIADVQVELARQFKQPLADKPHGLSDDGERETVHRIHVMISQCLDTFDPEKMVTVSAFGNMGCANWDTKKGAYQEVTISIKPT